MPSLDRGNWDRVGLFTLLCFLRWREGSHILNLMSPSLMHKKFNTRCLAGYRGVLGGWFRSFVCCLPFRIFFFFFLSPFLKERNIRKTFALTLNPPPQVTVIAGPRGGEKKTYRSNLGPSSLDNIGWGEARVQQGGPGSGGLGEGTEHEGLL